ncbi:MAG: deoxyribonuclease IV [Mycoplasmataceae bacterium]|nr:deoxyribonuclease IV [Mycoplasmataceae bacterium]
MIKLGSHISFKSPGYLVNSVEEAISYGANTLMIYLGAPQNTKRVTTEKYFYEEYLEKLSKIIPPKDIIIHAPYIVNPSNPEKSEFAIEFLIQEIERMNYIGCKYLVLHPGSSLKFGSELGLKTLIKSIKKILSKTLEVEIILETMSGKGSEIGSNLLELKQVIEEVNDDRLGICLDTCHLWDAGYDIKNNLNDFMRKLKNENLLKWVKVIHLNDSKNDLNSHKDRHENIGKGFIGFKALQNFLFHPSLEGVITILETPWVDGKPIYKEEIKKLLAKEKEL